MTPRFPKSPFVLLEGAFAKGPGALYSEPLRNVRADRAEEVPAALAAIDAAVAEGRHVAGMLAYELGYALEPRLTPLMPGPRKVPLIWMGVFEAPAGPAQERPEQGCAVRLPSEAEPNVSPAAYRAGVERIQDYIRAGDVYQVNYTHALTLERPEDAWALYGALKNNQPVPFPAALDLGEATILSLSPELFFRVENGVITARPMKGTGPRARLLAEDRAAALALQHDEKNRAENLMIVDLLRNDLSKIAQTGTVRVPALFTVETYRTLHTLTSTIEADLKPETTPSDIVKALFPCGSVTGAPKIRAMEIIAELEPHARGVYTGSIGVFRPDGSACFNVAIRTLTIPANGPASIGVGGAILIDSDAASEAAETQLKARFLTGLPARAGDQAPLQLIETLRWTPAGGFDLLREHLERLEDSAAYYGYPFARSDAKAALDERARAYSAPMRVRVTLAGSGALTITDAPFGGQDTLWRYAVSDTRIKSEDPYLAHKTTRRALYDEEHARLAREIGCDEILYLNERGELVEGGRTNLFIERDGHLLTPPLSSGCLPGTLRRHLIESRRADEAVMTLADLETADVIYFGNSVRGLVRAERIGKKAPLRTVTG